MKNEINIEKIAKLSMLTVSEEEKQLYRNDLEEIIAFAEEISDMKIENNLSEKPNTELKNVFRDDTVTNTPDRESMLKNAETNDGEYISVPKILGGKG